MKEVIEYKSNRAINWKEAFQLTADIIRYNHYGATVANGNTAENLIHRAAQMGVTVRKYEHSVEIMTRYGEPECLSYAYDILTASKKRNPTPRNIRHERKADREKAQWYNIDRHHQWTSNESVIGAEARNIRDLRKKNITNIKYEVLTAKLISDYDSKRGYELEARLNYPEQVTLDLCGRNYNNRYQKKLPF